MIKPQIDDADPRRGYKGASVMDCGYFLATPGGLMHFPPKRAEDEEPPKPVLIPWPHVLPDEEEEGESDE